MAVTEISNALIFDGRSADLAEGRKVVIEDGIIRSVDTGGFSHADRKIDAGGRVLMPGLIDAHFHAYSSSLDPTAMDTMPASLRSQYAGKILEGALQRGFTTVRDAGGADHGLAQALELGLIEGPRLFFSGKALSQTGGHGDLRDPKAVSACSCAYTGTLTHVVDGEEAVRLAVREELRKGATQIKLMISGGVLSPSDPIWMKQFTDGEIRAAVEEAATRRTYVMAHAHTADAARRCVDLGIRSIEHGTLIDPDAAKHIAGSECFVVPTLAIMDGILNSDLSETIPASSLEKLKDVMRGALTAVEECAKAGVNLGFGTDLLGPLHQNQGREFLLRSEVQPKIDVLISATSLNARLLDMEGALGVIAPEAKADLLLVNGNPLENIDILARPEASLSMIMKDGRIVRNDLGYKS